MEGLDYDRLYDELYSTESGSSWKNARPASDCLATCFIGRPSLPFGEVLPFVDIGVACEEG